jgi:hypothetical protein
MTAGGKVGLAFGEVSLDQGFEVGFDAFSEGCGLDDVGADAEAECDEGGFVLMLELDAEGLPVWMVFVIEGCGGAPDGHPFCGAGFDAEGGVVEGTLGLVTVGGGLPGGGQIELGGAVAGLIEQRGCSMREAV